MKPDMKFRAGLVSATIWQNPSEKGSYATVTLSRAYLDKSNVWKDTGSLRSSDLPKAALVLQKAYEYLQLKPDSSSAKIV